MMRQWRQELRLDNQVSFTRFNILGLWLNFGWLFEDYLTLITETLETN